MMRIRLVTSGCFLGAMVGLGLFVFQACSSSDPLLTDNLPLPTLLAQPAQPTVPASPFESSALAAAYRGFSLNHFRVASEDELLAEMRSRKSTEYARHVRILADWVSKSLSARERLQLSRNCEFLLGPYDKTIPLNDYTIACSAWWVERRNTLLAQDRKNNLSLRTPVSLAFSESQKKDWHSYQNMTFPQAMAALDIPTLPKAHFFVQKALTHANECSFRNVNSALLLKLENYLPNESIYTGMENLYVKYRKCLIPNQDPSEKIHLRMGVLRLIQGQPDKAQKALIRTQKEVDPQENSRSLFWLGKLQRNQHAKETGPDEGVQAQTNNTESNTAENPYWKQLIAENPLSLAALVASQELGVDPTSSFVADEKVLVRNRVAGGWNRDNVEAFVFEVLWARRYKEAAMLWADNVVKTTQATDPGLILYWSALENRFRHYFASLQMLSRYNRYQKQSVMSRGLLDLYFPRAYLYDILRASSTVDPIFTLAVMRQESAFDERARSLANARGLLQIVPHTAQAFHRSIQPADLYEPEMNIQIGTRYLERLFRRFHGQAEFVLAAYNAGPVNVDRWRSRVTTDNMLLFCDFIPFKETRTYISIILRNYYWYYRIFSESNDALSRQMIRRSQQSLFHSDRVRSLLSFAAPTPETP